MIDLIASLVTKSLLVAELAGNEQRYWLLESSRQYARDKLIARGEQDDFARRHAIFYVELAERREREWDTIPDHAWLPQATVELENWRAALEWALARRGDVTLGQRMAAVRAVMWRSFTLAEGRRWVRAAMELVLEDTPFLLTAQLEHSEAEGARRFGDFQMAFTKAESALSRFCKLGDARGIAETQSLAGAMLSVLGRPGEAEPLLREALEAADTIGDCRLRASTLFRLGLVRNEVADYAGAEVYFTEALELAKALGATIISISVRIALAQNEHFTGNAEKALQLIEDVLADYRSLNASGAAISAAYALTDRATYLIALGRYDEARVQANNALTVGREGQLVFVIARSLQQLAVLALLGAQVEHVPAAARHAGAARLFGFVQGRLTTLGSLEDLERDYYISALALLRDTVGAEKLTKMMATGATMTEDEAVAQAHALEATSA